VRLLRWRPSGQLRPLDEAECYARCHGERDEEVRALGEVQVLRPKPRRPRLLPRLSGEHLRRCFEKRLESRADARFT
jgi:hypothetical protein